MNKEQQVRGTNGPEPVCLKFFTDDKQEVSQLSECRRAIENLSIFQGSRPNEATFGGSELSLDMQQSSLISTSPKINDERY